MHKMHTRAVRRLKGKYSTRIRLPSLSLDKEGQQATKKTKVDLVRQKKIFLARFAYRESSWKVLSAMS